jgi:AcrR family transcriptional regulator
MAGPPLIRPGGRSERIQKAVHEAVKALKAENEAIELSVPMIAERANVTPSTIYRRWGTVGELLADVAAERFRPDADLPDSGSLRGDLEIWLERFVDDISTGVGFALIQERVANTALARRAAGYAQANFEVLVNRATGRSEPAPDPDRLIDLLVAPVIYRLVFAGQQIEKRYQLELIKLAMDLLPG